MNLHEIFLSVFNSYLSLYVFLFKVGCYEENERVSIASL